MLAPLCLNCKESAVLTCSSSLVVRWHSPLLLLCGGHTVALHRLLTLWLLTITLHRLLTVSLWLSVTLGGLLAISLRLSITLWLSVTLDGLARRHAISSWLLGLLRHTVSSRLLRLLGHSVSTRLLGLLGHTVSTRLLRLLGHSVSTRLLGLLRHSVSRRSHRLRHSTVSLWLLAIGLLAWHTHRLLLSWLCFCLGSCLDRLHEIVFLNVTTALKVIDALVKAHQNFV